MTTPICHRIVHMAFLNSQADAEAPRKEWPGADGRLWRRQQREANIRNLMGAGILGRGHEVSSGELVHWLSDSARVLEPAMHQQHYVTA